MIKEKYSTTEHYRCLIQVLGKKYVKSKIESPFDFIHIASKGVNARVVQNFRTYFNLTLYSTAHMLSVSEPTLYRWAKANKDLDRNFSIKLFEIADLFLYGSKIFESQENFFKWLSLPNTALGGMEPGELVEVPGGVSKVKEILGRIEHGVYS